MSSVVVSLVMLALAPVFWPSLLVAAPGPGAGQRSRTGAGPGSAAPSVAVAARAETAPILDGRDDDAIWRTAPAITGFRQFEPREDAAPSFRTEFRVAYDNRNLYVFVRAFDPHPDSIRHALSHRDVRGPSDQLKLIIDGFHDRRSGVELAVNPDGVKRDYSVYNDATEDDSWNGVWYVVTRVDSLGWTAEFRVPFSQLRYSGGRRHTFGFGVWRDIDRYKERDSWPVYRESRAGLMSQLGELEGIADIGSSRPLELTPYVVARNISRSDATGDSRVEQQTLGADLKYGITPNLTLTATMNPDFGQVEADPAVVNLTAFESFFQERRPFFVEGTGVYQFPLNCYIVHDCGNEGLFYSRRIGRSPQLLDTYGDAASPGATPILAAAKVTGRSVGGLAVGVLDAVTERVMGSEARTIEPLTNYAVIRARQYFRSGESEIGVIATAVNRSLDTWTADLLRRDGYVVGGDFRHRFDGGRYQVSGALVGSRVEGAPAAIAATQLDNVHGFQRPDGPARYDSTRVSLSGSSQELIFGKYGGGIIRFETALERQSAGFEPNDLGYLQRADQQSWDTWAALTFRRPQWIYKSLQWNVNQWNAWTTDGLRLESAVNTNAHMALRNNWWLHAGVTESHLAGTFCDRCSRGGPALRSSPTFSGWFGVNGDDRRVVIPNLWVNLGRDEGGRSSYVDVSPSAAVRLSTRLQGSVGVDISHNIDDSQWFGNFTDSAGVTHYAFAHLDQRTLSFSTRLSYAATPNLTVDFYTEPFVSTGAYTDVRELSAKPGAKAYEDRFRAYVPPAGTSTGFDFEQLRANAVVRWEYRPGSTLYLVWTHARDGYVGTASGQPWAAEYRDLFRLYPDNTFLVKLSYWLGR
jgi:Domain of unknown function (DUF5916)